MTQMKQSKKQIVNEFAKKHKVGSKVHGMKIFDIAREKLSVNFIKSPPLCIRQKRLPRWGRHK